MSVPEKSRDINVDERSAEPERKTPTLLVTTPFGIGVKDSAWLRHRLILISAITAPSLLAQTNQAFSWAIFVDPELPVEMRKELQRLLAPFGDRAILQSAARYGGGATLQLAAELGLVDEEGMVLTGIIDDDDAWSVDVVDNVYKRLDEWHESSSQAKGIGITFEHGLEWLMYDMVDVDFLQHRGRILQRGACVREYRVSFLGTSVFVCGRLRDGASALARGHSHMEEFLNDKSFDVHVVSTNEPMWLYCRHKQAGSGIQKSKAEDLAISVDSLTQQFGLDGELVQKYLREADQHGYGLVKRMARRQAALRSELSHLQPGIRDGGLGQEERDKLLAREREIRRELDEMAGEVVGRLDVGIRKPESPSSESMPGKSTEVSRAAEGRRDPVTTKDKFDLTAHYERFWRKYRSGKWEPTTKALVDEILDEGDLFVDIGAWIGPVSLWALGRGANVIAIEPDPVAVEELRRLVPQSVEIWEGAVGIDSGVSKLGGPTKLQGALGTSMSRIGSDGSIEVQMWTLPEILDGRVPSLVKIDVEGFEVELLPSLAPWLAEVGVPLQVSLHGVMPDRAIFSGYREVRMPRAANGTLVARP